MRIGFTGTRKGMKELQAAKVFWYLKLFKLAQIRWLHHGDCVGSDEDFHNMAIEIGYHLVCVHPPLEEKYRAFLKEDAIREPKAYLDRNKDIVNETDLLIATPEGKETVRSGTWSTVRYARTLKKPIIIIYPDGTEQKE